MSSNLFRVCRYMGFSIEYFTVYDIRVVGNVTYFLIFNPCWPPDPEILSSEFFNGTTQTNGYWEWVNAQDCCPCE